VATLPEPRIDTLDSLREHLQWAIELEHATLPPYLTALYSLDPERNPAAVEVLSSVFVEEMLHLALAANLLNAVGGAPRRYRGERALFLFQNLHRYTLYCALVLLVCLWWEAGSAFFLDGRPGVGVGTVMMVINAALLSAYAFGCHSWRHLIGGRADCFSCGGSGSPRYGVWKGSSWLNERHMLFAWCSLVWVACTDLYVYLLSTGTVHDLSTW